ncbi:MAG: SAM-dependent methyltransferase, partial [Pseudomonadota bacterium]|nr:SAM-dependent methyltransferase [Pseudomonadota bacterium]
LAGASVHFVETSPTLRDVQLQTVGDEVDLTWHKDVDEALRSGKGPIFGVANEFFDALPVAQKVMEGGKWHERQVGIREDRLGYVIGPALSETDPALPETPPDGAVAELCPQACAIAMKLGDALVRRGGAILIVDYGREGNLGDSLQAVNDHRAVDPFEAPGEADLSHWVDFAALASAVRSAGARLVGPVPQGRFLMQIGLGARAEQAGLNAEPEVRRDLLSAVDRLTSPAQMGEVFKVALLLPPGEGEPPGFMQEEV